MAPRAEAAGRVDVGILGPLQVRVDGRSVELPGGKPRLVVAALAVQPNCVVSTDALYEVLWGGAPPGSAANTLQTYVSHLRKALEPDRTGRQPGRHLRTREPGYLLALGPEDVDAGRFERLARDGRRELATSPERAAATLREALSLWRGEPLGDFTYEPFAQAHITRLAELRVAALEDRLDADLARGAHHALCAELAQLVAEHPLRERLCGQLMVALYRNGRQADALQAYRDLRDRLVEQLGIDPSPALVQLERAVLQQRPELEWPPAGDGRVARYGGGRQEPARAQAPGGDRRAFESVEELVARAREALGARRWEEAYDRLSAADQRVALDGELLDGLADAALWLGLPHESLAARQRAHAAFVAAGARARAAMVAVFLALHFGARLRLAVAGGWFQRAEHLLEEEPEGPAHGHLAWAGTMFAIATGDREAAVAAADRMLDVGRRFGVPELQALGLTFRGYLRVHDGRVRDGLAAMDEGMTWAVTGQLAPFPSSLIFCKTISTCYDLGDFRRASEWMDAIGDCAARTGIGPLPGDCEIHSVAVLVGRGAWSEGETRARLACAAMEKVDLTHVGAGLAEIGDIRRRRGDLAGARQAYRRAAEMGVTPQPGIALLRLAEGDVAGASASIAGALADETWNRLVRARLRAAQVEIELAAGGVDAARAAVAELDAVAGDYPSPALQAAAGCARGALLLAEGDAGGAADTLRRAVRGWSEVSAPYEAARARILLGEALNRTGDAPGARAELDRAIAVLESLGASPALERARAQLARAQLGRAQLARAQPAHPDPRHPVRSADGP